MKTMKSWRTSSRYDNSRRYPKFGFCILFWTAAIHRRFVFSCGSELWKDSVGRGAVKQVLTKQK